MLHEISAQASVFSLLHQEALVAAQAEPLLADMLDTYVVSQSRLEGCLTAVMASVLTDRTLSVEALAECF